jgi:DNA-binding Xre family transcriptional regulator
MLLHIARTDMRATLSGVRLRLPELLEKHGITPYGLAKRSGGRISLSAAYRYVRKKGRLASFDSALLEALCDVLEEEPGALLERDRKRRK